MDKPIYLAKTQGEWRAIEKAISKMGRNNFNKFIRAEVNKLGNAYLECPDCITQASGGDRIEKRPKIPMESYKKIEKIAERMNVKVSTVVDILIILPLLQGKSSETQHQI